MSAALPNDHPFDGSRTAETGFSCPPEYLEIILKIPAPVNPINAGTVALDPLCQHLADCSPEVIGLIQWYLVSPRLGMDACQKEGLIRVDISHASQKMLVKQQRFYLTVPGLQFGEENLYVR